MYLLSLKQVFLQAISIAIIIAVLNISYFEFISYRNLPEVVVTPENKCVIVINFNNGDAYQCADVDVVLRKYKQKVKNG